MGYRSEVGYVIQFEDKIQWSDTATEEDKKITPKDLFNMLLNDAKTNPNTKLCFDDDDGIFTMDSDKLLIKFHADDVKWYDSFDDVLCHEAFIDMVQEYVDAQESNDKYKAVCISYGFVRIGEEVEDIETKYGGYDGFDLIYPTRGIEFNV